MIFRILHPVSTVPRLGRFRAVLAFVGMLLFPLPALAAARPFPVMISAPVAANARAEMPEKLWADLVRGWINADRTIPAGDAATVEDCRRSAARYLVVAPFALSPNLPGAAHSNDRISAQTHATITACKDGSVIFDRTVMLESDPLSLANPGDIEPNYDVTWNRSIRSTFGHTPIAFPASARVAEVEGDYVYLDLPSREGLFVGEILRVRGGGTPVEVQVTDLRGKWTQATLATPGARVRPGDIVEATAPASVSGTAK